MLKSLAFTALLAAAAMANAQSPGPSGPQASDQSQPPAPIVRSYQQHRGWRQSDQIVDTQPISGVWLRSESTSSAEHRLRHPAAHRDPPRPRPSQRHRPSTRPALRDPHRPPRRPDLPAQGRPLHLQRRHQHRPGPPRRSRLRRHQRKHQAYQDQGRPSDLARRRARQGRTEVRRILPLRADRRPPAS